MTWARVGRRCLSCALIVEPEAGKLARHSRQPGQAPRDVLPDPAELLVLAEADPAAALATLE
jgi:hypothetical protein